MAKKKVKTYIALVGLRNDATGARFKARDTVKSTDFDKAVIDEWLKIGVLTDGSNSKR